ncbi:hypothetical protein [Polycladidibacter stylochi]|uniref:hypothetical protein n=1 Tax=Polycladidibacter stylochi TaxID=1807766 RepID=UPI0012E365A8|nr:hypothetical protein [Pseudovibrio stylochi]
MQIIRSHQYQWIDCTKTTDLYSGTTTANQQKRLVCSGKWLQEQSPIPAHYLWQFAIVENEGGVQLGLLDSFQRSFLVYNRDSIIGCRLNATSQTNSGDLQTTCVKMGVPFEQHGASTIKLDRAFSNHVYSLDYNPILLDVTCEFSDIQSEKVLSAGTGELLLALAVFGPLRLRRKGAADGTTTLARLDTLVLTAEDSSYFAEDLSKGGGVSQIIIYRISKKDLSLEAN